MTTFCGLEFETNDKVLKPYMTTEKIVEKAIEMLSEKHNPTFLDIGCGSGNIAISILANLPGAHGMAVDISQDAIDLARANADRHQVADRLDVRKSDAFETVDGRFDLIVCNSPYMTGERAKGLPLQHAYTDGKDGLTLIRETVQDASDYLLKNGSLLFEYAGDFNDAVWLKLGGVSILRDPVTGWPFGAIFGV